MYTTIMSGNENGNNSGDDDKRGRGEGRGKVVKPTDETYKGFQAAYDVLNRELFGRRLPPCMITLRTFGKARGYFSPDRFVHLERVTTTHEIALDPRQFMDRTSLQVLSTLAHEMCHVEQREHGTPSRSGYHNREWVAMMETIGLVPSSTGEPGGKQTGQNMTHYIEPGGRFEKTATKLINSGRFTLGWADIDGFLDLGTDPKSPAAKAGPAGLPVKPAKGPRSGVRVKYVCPTCATAVWGKARLLIGCLGTDDTSHDPAMMEA